MMRHSVLCAIAASMLVLSACSSVIPQPTESVSLSAQQLDVGFCDKQVQYPHKSTTISTEIVSKAVITCALNKNKIFVTGTVSLYKKVGTSYQLIRTGAPRTAALSPTVTVRLPTSTSPSNALLAAGPCVNGVYQGRLKTEYKNFSGVTIKIGMPLSTPDVNVTNC